LDLPLAGDLQSIPGKGVRGDLDGEEVLIGNKKLFDGIEAESDPLFESVLSEAEKLEAEGKTTMIVNKGGHFLGVIGFSDRPRPEAKSTLKRLKDLGVESLVMITGDNERVSAAVAAEVGATDQISGLLPQEKVSSVDDLLRRYGSVAMVGDGVNDAPALVRASVGIAMGAGGADVALETADVALISDDLLKLPFAVALGRRSRGIICQNLAISLTVIALMIPMALSGLAGIGLAIVLHEGSTLLVVANALRLLRFQPK
jgi:Cd2+/Zn2+-exporting ATPase